MGRLIDADKLYDDLADKLKWLMGYGDDVYLSVGDDIRCAVANQPTAYDLDKVVEQLEKLKTINVDIGFGTTVSTLRKDVVMEIVKAVE